MLVSDATIVPGPILSVRGLAKTYANDRGERVQALAEASFELRRGEVLGVVGESGCGKTTLGRALMRLVEPSEGAVLLDGEDFLAARGHRLKGLRKRMQMVFQDPFGSLNPRHKVGQIVGEPLKVHGVANRAPRVRALLAEVGLPEEAADRFPHEFSGGQRQRIAIARALALQPDVIIADEPVSALDVSIQSQIINLIARLKRDYDLAMLFISHDLSVVRHVSDRIAVMYFGRIVEIGPAETIFAAPAHPYTRALISAIPRLPGAFEEAVSDAGMLAGELPDPSAPPPGCAFAGRCPVAIPRCREERPPLRPVGDPSHGLEAACHLAEPPRAA